MTVLLQKISVTTLKAPDSMKAVTSRPIHQKVFERHDTSYRVPGWLTNTARPLLRIEIASRLPSLFPLR